MSLTIPFSQACERNKDVILSVIKHYLADGDSVLEVGSGTGQHALYFASALPNLSWQMSDQFEYLDGLEAQLLNTPTANVIAPIELDVTRSNWNTGGVIFDAIYTANTFHIMSWEVVQAFFDGLRQVSDNGSVLIVYGPFKYAGEFTSASNEVFDASLRARGVGSSIRDFEAVDRLALEQGFELIEDRSMPANNQCIIWRKTA